MAIENLDNVKVYNPVELIELYIGEYQLNANEYDFKKALDLIQFIDKERYDVDVKAVLIDIWSQAILRDRWENVSATDLLQSCRDTVFFRTLDLAIAEDLNLSEYLPSVDELLQSRLLESLSSRQEFQYLVRGIYEHIGRRV